MASRVEKLNKGGILAWEVDGVLGRLTKAQSKNEAFVLRMKPIVEMGVILATHIRDRSIGILSSSDELPQPCDKRGWHREGPGERVPGQVVSAEYAAAGGLPTTTFASSADLHNAAKPIRGVQRYANVTGGMWAGIQARGSGKSGVIIDFGGTSPGHGSAKPTFVATAERVGGEGGKPIPVMVRAGEMVRNQNKAWVVFTKVGKSPIEPLGVENIALCEAATALMQRAVIREFGDTGEYNQQVWELDFGGDPVLREKLLVGWVR